MLFSFLRAAVRHFVGYCTLLLALCVLFVVACALFASYLYHDPARLTSVVHKFAPATHVSVQTFEFDYANTAIQLHAHTMGITHGAVDAHIKQTTLALTLHPAFPYVHVNVSLLAPVVTHTVSAQTASVSTAMVNSFAAMRIFSYLDDFSIKAGRIMQNNKQLPLSVAFSGSFSRNPKVQADWVSRILLTDEYKRYTEIHATGQTASETKEALVKVAIDDTLLVRHFGFVRSALAADEQPQSKQDIQSTTHLAIKTNTAWQKWRAVGNSHIKSRIPLPIESIVWQVNGDTINNFFVRAHDTDRQGLDVSVRRTTGRLHLRVQAQQLVTTAFLPLVQYFAPHAGITAFLGTFNDLQAEVTLAQQNNQWQIVHTDAHAQVDNFGYQLSEESQAPTFAGISGVVSIAGTVATLQMNSDRFALALPHIFNQPLAFSFAEGEFRFATTHAFDRLIVTTRALALQPQEHRLIGKQDNPHLVLDMTWAVGVRHTLALDIELHKIAATFVKQRYFPNRLFKQVNSFLQTNVRAGVLTKGRVGLAFDFTDKVTTDVDITLDFDKVVMSVPQLPHFTQAVFTVDVVNAATTITLRKAQLQGVQTTDATIIITHAATSMISVQGKAAGSLADLRGESFAGGVISKVHQYATEQPLALFAGDWQADIQVDWQLNGTQAASIYVQLDVSKWRTDNYLGQRINRFDGAFAYTSTKGIESVTPKTIIINDTQAAVRHTANGSIVSNLAVNLNAPLLLNVDYVQGLVPTDLQLTWNQAEQVLLLRWQPRWQSVAVHTPVFDKPASSKWDSVIHTHIHFAEQTATRIYGTVAHFWFDFTQRADDYSGCLLYDEHTQHIIQRTAAAVQKQLRPLCDYLAHQSATTNLLLLLRTGTLNMESVLQLFTDLDTTQIATAHESSMDVSWLASPLPNVVDYASFVSTDFHFGDYGPAPLSVEIVKRTANKQMLTISSSWAKGTVEMNSTTHTLDATFSQLILKLADDEQGDKKQKNNTQTADLPTDAWRTINPARLPTITLAADALYFDERPLGALTATMVPTKEGNASRASWQAQTSKQGIALLTTGVWHYANNKHHTSVDLQVQLNDYTVSKTTDVRTATLTTNLHWRGSPTAARYDALNGTFLFDIADAYVKDTDSGVLDALKIIGVLNILDIIDLLELQGGDKKDTLHINTASARMSITNGLLAYSQPLRIHAFGFTAQLTGKASLVTHEVDMQADIELKIQNTLNIAALAGSYPTIVAAPAVGIPLAWLLNKIVVQPLTNLSYRISGNAESDAGIQIQNISIKQPQ